MRVFRGYRAVALIQLFMCLCFFINPGTEHYGALFGIANFFAAGIFVVGTLLSYFDPKRWTLWLTAATMFCIMIFNSVWFISQGVFMTTGFPLIAYDALFIVANLHFLGRGLR